MKKFLVGVGLALGFSANVSLYSGSATFRVLSQGDDVWLCNAGLQNLAVEDWPNNSSPQEVDYLLYKRNGVQQRLNVRPWEGEKPNPVWAVINGSKADAFNTGRTELTDLTFKFTSDRYTVKYFVDLCFKRSALFEEIVAPNLIENKAVATYNEIGSGVLNTYVGNSLLSQDAKIVCENGDAAMTYGPGLATLTDGIMETTGSAAVGAAGVATTLIGQNQVFTGSKGYTKCVARFHFEENNPSVQRNPDLEGGDFTVWADVTRDRDIAPSL